MNAINDPDNTRIEAPVLDNLRRREWHKLACCICSVLFYCSGRVLLSCMEAEFSIQWRGMNLDAVATRYCSLSGFGRDETSGYGADDITSFADTSEFSAEASCDYSEILGPMK